MKTQVLGQIRLDRGIKEIENNRKNEHNGKNKTGKNRIGNRKIQS